MLGHCHVASPHESVAQAMLPQEVSRPCLAFAHVHPYDCHVVLEALRCERKQIRLVQRERNSEHRPGAPDRGRDPRRWTWICRASLDVYGKKGFGTYREVLGL